MPSHQGGLKFFTVFFVVFALVLISVFAVTIKSDDPISSFNASNITNQTNETNASINMTLNNVSNATSNSTLNVTFNSTQNTSGNATINGTALLNQTNISINSTTNTTINQTFNQTIGSNVTINTSLNVSINTSLNETDEVIIPITKNDTFNGTNITANTTFSYNYSNVTNVSFIMSGTGGPTVKKTYIFAGQQMLASKSDDQPSQTFFYIQDHLGSNLAVYNGSLKQADDSYYAFGEEKTSSADAVKNDFKFTGQEKDPESGLYYYGARYYDSNSGRFLQPDALTGSLDNPLTLNTYAYVQNNPLKLIDPSGNEAIPYWDPRFIGPLTPEQQKDRDAFNRFMQSILISYFYDKPNILNKLKGWKFYITTIPPSEKAGGLTDSATKTIYIDVSAFATGNLQYLLETVSHELAHGAGHEGLTEQDILDIDTRIGSLASQSLSQGNCDNWACKFQTDIYYAKDYLRRWRIDHHYTQDQIAYASGQEFLAFMNEYAVAHSALAPPTEVFDAKIRMFGDSLYNSPNYVQSHITTRLDSLSRSFQKKGHP
jgi:RHS repeat-associated protein